MEAVRPVGRPPPSSRASSTDELAWGSCPPLREESSEEKLGKVVRQIWEEKGGLGTFTQDELDRSIAAANEEGRQGEDELMAGQDDDTKPEGEDAAEPVSEETTTLDKGIAPEQMKALKMEISDRLGYVEPQSSRPIALRRRSPVLRLMLACPVLVASPIANLFTRSLTSITSSPSSSPRRTPPPPRSPSPHTSRSPNPPSPPAAHSQNHRRSNHHCPSWQ